MADSFRHAGYVSGLGDQALFVLFNNETSDARRKFTLTRCDIKPAGAASATPNRAVLRRISAASGGDTVQTVKADTSASDLPSQVTLATDADVTNGTEIFTSQLTIPISTAGLSLRGTARRASGAVDAGRVFNSGLGDGAVQRLAMAAGEGIAITALDGTAAVSNAGWCAQGAIRVQSTGAVHYFVANVSPKPPGLAALAIMNGSGSGVTIELAYLNLTEIGQPTITNVLTDAPLVRYCRVSGYDGGQSVTAFTPDTSVSAPSAMQTVVNRAWAPLTAYPITAKSGNLSADEFGYPSSNVALWRKQGAFGRALVNMNAVMGPGVTGAWMSEFRTAPLAAASNTQHGLFMQKDAAIQGLVLNPQEGFALICDNFSAYNSFYIDLEWTHTPPPTAGGGAAYRVVGSPVVRRVGR